MRSKLKQCQAGVTLMEAMAAIAVFSIGIMGMSSLQSYTHNQIREQHHRNVSIWKGLEMIERIKANNSDAAIAQYIASINSNNLCNAAPAVLCAETFDNLAAVEVAANVCTATQMASFDTWDVFCASENSLNEELDNFDSTISCATPPCNSTVDLELTLTWDSSVAVGDSRLTANTLLIELEDGTVQQIPASKSYFRQVFRP